MGHIEEVLLSCGQIITMGLNYHFAWHFKYVALLFIFKVVPEQPQNLSCTQKGEHGTVACTWDRGRDTHLPTAYTLQ